MHKSLHGCKVALLVANGFDEMAYIEVQKILQGSGASLTLVSADKGLVNGWRGTEWGLNFPADHMLSSALAADFDMLVVPGGERCMAKMQGTAHTRRFMNGFLDMFKPVVLVNEAVDLLSFIERSAQFDLQAEAGLAQDKAMMTMAGTPAEVAVMVQTALMPFMDACFNEAKAA